MLALGVASQTPTVATATWINFARRLRDRGSRFHTAQRSWAQLRAGFLDSHSEAAGNNFSPALRPSYVQCRKPGCHLCDGLKEKVQAVLAKAMFQPSPLSHANLQVRNILDEPEWEAAYGMVIPVLTAIKSGEKEEIKIPRAPPRITADRLADHIAKSLKL